MADESSALVGLPDPNLARQMGGMNAKPNVMHTSDPKKADKTAKDFEAMFLSNMLQPVFAGLKTGESGFGGGNAEDTFQTMMVDEYSKAIAKSGGIGIADMVRKEILTVQEKK